jgi:hypothetical protein
MTGKGRYFDRSQGKLDRVTTHCQGKYSIEPADDSLTIREVEQGASVSFLLPHSDASGYNVIVRGLTFN